MKYIAWDFSLIKLADTGTRTRFSCGPKQLTYPPGYRAINKPGYRHVVVNQRHQWVFELLMLTLTLTHEHKNYTELHRCSVTDWVFNDKSVPSLTFPGRKYTYVFQSSLDIGCWPTWLGSPFLVTGNVDTILCCIERCLSVCHLLLTPVILFSC